MKRFIFVITMALGWAGLSFSTPALNQTAAPPAQLANETVTGNKVTGFCDPKETAIKLLASNVFIAVMGLLSATIFAMEHEDDDRWGVFLMLGALSTLINHIAQIGISIVYYCKCRNNTAI